jgi:hypothetical protein
MRITHCIEEEVIIIRVEVQWCYMTSLHIPLTVEVIGCDCNPIQVLTNSLYIITWKLITMTRATTTELLLNFKRVK